MNPALAQYPFPPVPRDAAADATNREPLSREPLSREPAATGQVAWRPESAVSSPVSSLSLPFAPRRGEVLPIGAILPELLRRYDLCS